MTILRTQSDTSFRLRVMLAVSTIIAGGIAVPALAQGAPSPAMIFDDNGIDINTGEFSIERELLSIGGSGSDGLSYEIWDEHGRTNHDISVGPYYGWGPEPIGSSVFSAKYNIQFAAGSVTDAEGEGRNLTYNSSSKIYTFTDRDGTRYLFDGTVEHPNGFNGLAIAPLKEKIFPDNTRHVYHWRFEQACITSATCAGPQDKRPVGRIQSITTSNGYQIKLNYARDANGVFGPSQASQWDEWRRVIKATAVNNAIEACSPTADICNLTQPWPYANRSISWSGAMSTESLIDAAGRLSQIQRNNSGFLAIKSSGSSVFDKTINRNGDTTIYTAAGSTWNYLKALTDGSNPDSDREVTITSPTGHITKQYIRSFPNPADFLSSVGKLVKTVDAGGQPWLYNHSEWGLRLEEKVKPGGQRQTFSHDERGNVTAASRVAQAGGPTALTNAATFASVCTNSLICNKPLTTTDARGQVTSYTYDATHGGVLTVTLPAPAAGVAQPQKRFSYSPLYAWYKNASGTLVQASTPVWKLTGISECSIGAAPACIDTAAETRTIISYGAAGAANNLLPTSITVRSGNTSGAGAATSTSTLSYDHYGNLVAMDGPLSGTADVTRMRYNAAHEVIGMIAPDPDGAGARKQTATRVTYDTAGRVQSTELGTVNGPSDADWAAFVSLQKATAAYDPVNRRKVQETITAGGQTHSLTQYSYDLAGRPKCIAVRIGLAASSDVCQQLSNAQGYDAVSETFYGPDGRVSKQRVGGVDTAAYGYTVNGKVATQTDAESNRTTYEYDGHDRLARTRYPSPTTDGVSSATDYEQPSYDGNGNVTALRLRDGQSIGFTYDNLDRLTFKDMPGGEPDVAYVYDLLGRVTSVTRPGIAHTLSYDALGRLLSEGQPFGSSSYQYDPAGRRTRLTWNDGFHVTYDYDVTGNITAIRENGAASGVGVLATYAYDDLGRRMGVTRGNGTTTAYTYDPVSRLASLGHNFAGTGHDLNLGFSYNPVGQIASSTRSNDAYAWTNHVNVDRAYVTNGLNQHTSAGPVRFSYDSRGNLTSSGSSSYAYTSENLMKSASGSTTLHYDGFGRMHEYNTSVSTRFIYDGQALSAEVANPSGAILKRYVHGPGMDEPLVWYEGAGTTDRRWLHADERGSIVAVSNGSGAVTAINAYDEYGIPGAANTGRFQYTGQTWLGALGMYYYKARMYSPTLGRFMQTDPIGYVAGMNMYAYVGNDPINYTDPMGLNPFIISSITGTIFQSMEPQAFNLLSSSGPDIVITAQLQDSIDLGGSSAAGGQGSVESSIGDIVVTARAESSPQNDEAQEGDIVVTAQVRILPRLGPPPSNLFARPPWWIRPPGWNQNWRWGPSRLRPGKSGQEPRWHSPKGEEWRYHPADKHHKAHWDYHPGTNPRAPWENRPLSPTPLYQEFFGGPLEA